LAITSFDQASYNFNIKNKYTVKNNNTTVEKNYVIELLICDEI